MKQKILSVVVPTYNMEQYLKRCLSSLINDEVIDDIEVIIVNDGSKDRSLDIAMEFQSLYPDSIVVIDKVNGNYGSCINSALKIAKGRYFRILDADDWFDTYGFVRFVNALQDYNVDMVFTHYSVITRNGNHLVASNYNFLNEVISVDSDAFSRLNIREDFVMHKITYSIELLKRIGLELSEGISYTDIEYVYYPLFYVNSVVYLDLQLYNYYIGRSGQTISIKSRIAHLSDLEHIMLRILERSLTKVSPNRYIAQAQFLVKVFSGYYHTLLVVQKLSPENKDKLLHMDGLIRKFDSLIYNRLDNIKTLGVPYIRFWRKYSINIIPSWLYNFLYNIRY